MKYTESILIIVVFLFSGLNGLPAQEAVVTTGGDFSGSGGKVSFSVGQPFYSTLTGGTMSVAQGVQQAYEISVISGIPLNNNPGMQISVYPNPVPDYLILKTDGFLPGAFPMLSYQLMGIDGRLLSQGKILGNESKIGMSHYAPGTYFLKVTTNNSEVKTFKIIKF